jgi:vitamin B12 transporter
MILAVFAAFTGLYSQDTEFSLPDVVVTAGRTPVLFSELTRCVEIITAKDIRNIPVNNIQDLLQYAAGVDVRQRGPEGVQADISIRGGSYEQTLVMIDGVKLNDPQTGHNSFNLPVSLNDVERIEILKGQGSKSFGANALSGVINIITKKEKDNSVSLTAMGGDFGLFDLGMQTAYTAGNFNNYLSFSKKKSDGYRYNTAFDAYNASYNSVLKTGGSKINLLLGYNNKEFGANGFYTTSPDQWEHLITTFASAGSEIHSGIFTFTPKFSWRKNKDRYLLNYKNPSLYENNHTTNVFDYEIQVSLNTPAGLSAIGVEVTTDNIKSSNLGNHSRDTKGIFAEHRMNFFNDVVLSAGVFVYDYPEAGWKYWPGIDLSYSISAPFRIYASAGKAFRIPSYTDLFYNGGGSEGNPDLKHEETTNYEAGAVFAGKLFLVNLSLFRKEGKNIIDWFYIPSVNVWKAENVSEINTNGIEVNLDYFPEVNNLVSQVGINYTYLDLKKSTAGSISRYLPDHLRHQVSINLANYLPFNIRQNWMFRYEDRVNSDDNFIIDTRIGYGIKDVDFYIKAANLLNKSHKDMQLIPLPGRWLSAGFDLKIGY